MSKSAPVPPRPRLTFSVGITGHRNLQPAAAAKLAHTIDDLLGRLAGLVAEVQAANAAAFAPDPPQLFLLSQLAAGADQIAARAALARGYGLRAALPFEPRAYRRDFTGPDAKAFSQLLAQSQAWWLPREGGDRDHAYLLAGQATVAQCDILIAVWDGRPARGTGGTAEVVDHGIRHGVPVIHLTPGVRGKAGVLWAGFDGVAADQLDRQSVPERALSDTILRSIVETLLSPPSAPDERAAMARFFKERMRRVRFRPEYPLLLAATGVRGLRSQDFVEGKVFANQAREWAGFRDQPIVAGEAMTRALDELYPAFAWADGLAEHIAQTYRGGLIFNYLAAAASVIVALSSFINPQAKIPLLVGELVLIGLLIANTTIGGRQQWHRRWLDYRYLAEQLRPLKSLKLLGAATPPRQVAAADRWTVWYARAIWRQMGPPPTIPDTAALAALVTHVTQHEVLSQIAYNEGNAHRLHTLDHRLHQVGTTLFYLTAVTGVATLIATFLGFQPDHEQATMLTSLSAGLPTIGAALFGIRGQGDFVGAAGRSAETAANLRKAAARLAESPMSLMTACRTAENVAATMLADLAEWRTAYRHRKLAIPA